MIFVKSQARTYCRLERSASNGSNSRLERSARTVGSNGRVERSVRSVGSNRRLERSARSAGTVGDQVAGPTKNKLVSPGSASDPGETSLSFDFNVLPQFYTRLLRFHGLSLTHMETGRPLKF